MSVGSVSTAPVLCSCRARITHGKEKERGARCQASQNRRDEDACLSPGFGQGAGKFTRLFCNTPSTQRISQNDHKLSNGILGALLIDLESEEPSPAYAQNFGMVKGQKSEASLCQRQAESTTHLRGHTQECQTDGG